MRLIHASANRAELVGVSCRGLFSYGKLVAILCYRSGYNVIYLNRSYVKRSSTTTSHINQFINNNIVKTVYEVDHGFFVDPGIKPPIQKHVLLTTPESRMVRADLWNATARDVLTKACK